MRRNSFIAILIVITLLSVGVSYAVLSSTLIINGTATMSGNFNVAFSATNVEKLLANTITTENTSASFYISGYTTTSSISSANGKYNDTLNFNVKLLAPGDSYKINYTITNYGTIDAELADLSNCSLTNACGITVSCSSLNGTVLKKNESKQGTITITWPYDTTCSQNDYSFSSIINAVQA